MSPVQTVTYVSGSDTMKSGPPRERTFEQVKSALK